MRTIGATTAGAFVLLASAASGQYATNVVSTSLGPGGGGIFGPANALGGPRGGGQFIGSIDVLTLGVGGSVVLGFGVTVKDGPGADLTCFENPIASGGTGDTFAEVVTVEVSTDGTSWARFPFRYVGPPQALPPLGTAPIGTFSGLCGSVPVVANVDTGACDPFDPVRSGGESFDLADLATDPAVTSGLVDLDDIRFVRLTDVPEGTVTDAAGNTVWDNGGPGGSADIDAVAVLNHAGTVDANQPTCDLSIDASGHLVWRLGDPDGFFNLDLATLAASVNLTEFPASLVLSAFQVASFDGRIAELRSLGPVVGSGVIGAFAVSVSDKSGRFSGDQVILQG